MTTAKNDVTGDLIKSKIGSSQKYADNYDAIFRKPQMHPQMHPQVNDEVVPDEEVHPQLHPQ